MGDSWQDDYSDAHDRYAGYRDAAYEFTWAIWDGEARERGADLRLHPIDEAAVDQASVWPNMAEHSVGGFPWDEIHRQVRSTPRRFEIAIWDGVLLCGLAIGMASRGKDGPDTNVTIRFLERRGGNLNALRGVIAPIAIDAADAYARVLGKRMIYLKNPSSGAVPRYRRVGFELAQRRAQGIYLGRNTARSE